MTADKINTFDVLDSRGSRNKYDFEIKEKKCVQLIINDLFQKLCALDGDPLDVLVLVNEPTFLDALWK
jgi:hypothetical protein